MTRQKTQTLPHCPGEILPLLTGEVQGGISPTFPREKEMKLNEFKKLMQNVDPETREAINSQLKLPEEKPPFKFFIFSKIRSANRLGSVGAKIGNARRAKTAMETIPVVKPVKEKRRVVFTRILGTKEKVMDKINMAHGLKPHLDQLVVRGYLWDDSPELVDDEYEQREPGYSEKPGLLITIESALAGKEGE